ncbi:MAG: hypothetical protein J1E02_06890 [Coprobacter sp.]|nr:hypothetical protein [Coprobacter sp.]
MVTYLSKSFKSLIGTIVSLLLFFQWTWLLSCSVNQQQNDKNTTDTKPASENQLKENISKEEHNHDTTNKPYSLANLVEQYPSDFSIQKLGPTWNWKTEAEPYPLLLYGEGTLNHGAIHLVCHLTQKGILYGRYRHSNGTQLDVNGYIKKNGDIDVQLGHGNETSFMSLYPLDNQSTQTKYPYFGKWGKKEAPVEITFRLGKEFFPAHWDEFNEEDSRKGKQAELETKFRNAPFDNDDDEKISNALLGYQLYRLYVTDWHRAQDYYPLRDKYYVRTVVNGIKRSADTQFRYEITCNASHLKLYSNSETFTQLDYPQEIIFKGFFDRYIDETLIFTYAVPVRAY